MKTKKFIAIAALSALATVTLTSCSSTSHNTTTPYGSLYNSLNDTIASANNNEYKLSLKTFYNSLKKNGNQLVTQNIQKAFYHTEYDAISLVLAKEYLKDKKPTYSLIILLFCSIVLALGLPSPYPFCKYIYPILSKIV